MTLSRNHRQTRPKEPRIPIANYEGSPSLSIESSQDRSFVSLVSLRSHRIGVAAEGIRLNLTNLKQLYGRKNEQEQLMQSFQRACEPDSIVEVVMINGVSGVGKTALVEDWKNSVVRKSSAYFLEAKYQQTSSVSEPFSALKVVFRQLLEYLSKDEDLRIIRDLLKETLGSQVRPLTNILPSLRKILLDEEEDDDDKEEEQSAKEPDLSSSTSTGNTDYEMMQLGLVFVRVLRAMGRPSHPIVLFLDDIQWADEDSMDFISSLMIDQDCRNFMLVGAFRVENVGRRSAGSLSVQSLVDRRCSQQSRNSRALSQEQFGSPSLPNGKRKKVSTRNLLARALSFRKTENEDTSESNDRRASTRNLVRGMSVRWSRVPINAKASSQAEVHETNIPPPPPDFSPAICILRKFTRGGTSRREQSREPDADQTPPTPESSPAADMFRKPTRSTSSSETETHELDEEPGKLIPTGSPPNRYRRNGFPVARSPVAIHRKGRASLSDSNHSASRRWGKGSLEKNQSVPRSPSRSRSFPYSVSQKRSNYSTSQRWRGPTKTSSLQPWLRRNIPSVSESPGRSTTSTNESNHYFAAVGGRTTSTSASVCRSSVASDLSLINENQVYDDCFGHDSRELNPHIADIELSNLDLDSVNSVISVLIDRRLEECMQLATIVARKTHGNAYSILQFLEMLQRAEFLMYSTMTYRWEWDAERINTETTVTANVGELLAARIKTLPTQTQSLLMIAACIGQTFHNEILERVALEENLLGGTSDSETAAYGLCRESLNQILYESCKAELIEEDQDETGVYRFLHDQVQKCLHTMIPDEKLPSLHLRVGRTIWQHKSFGGNTKYLFATVNHLNLGAFHIEDRKERIQLIELNLQASKIARSAYSFHSAALFLEKGILLIDYDEDWDHHYALLLEIHTAAAELHYACGNLKKSLEFAEEVIEHSTCIEDEVRAYVVKVDALGAQRKSTEALTEGFKVLDLLGCHIPRKMKTVHLFVDLQQIRRDALGKSSECILSMAPMTDIIKVYTLRLLDSMTLLLWMIGHDSLVSILMTRMTLITLNHGISVYSPFSFAAYGMLLSHSGDVRGAYRFGSWALKLAEKLRSKLSLARTALMVYTFTNHLKKPLMDSLEPMLNAHRLGLQAGDVDYSSMCLSTYACLYVVVGLPLKPYVEDMKLFCEQLELHNQTQCVALMTPYWQLALNLMGKAENARVLDGEAMDYEAFLEIENVENRDQGVAMSNLRFVMLFLAYVFQDTPQLKRWFREGRQQKSLFTGTHFLNYYEILFSGLAGFSIYRATGKKKYFNHGIHALDTLRNLVKTCGINSHPLHLFLLAERQSFRKDTERARKCYDKAISTFARCGSIHLVALACERAGDLMSAASDTFWSHTYYNRSKLKYLEWGASAKAEELIMKHNLRNLKLKKKDQPPQMAISMRGQRRYDPSTWSVVAPSQTVVNNRHMI